MSVGTEAQHANVRTETVPAATRRYRIASCIDSMADSGGSELNAMRTARALKTRGHDVTCVTLNRGTGGMAQRYAEAGIEVCDFPVDSLVSRTAWRQVRCMAQLFRQQHIDIVHTHDSYTNFLMVLAARLARIPALASKRYVEHFRPQHRHTNRVAFRLARGVLANSQQVAHSARVSEGVALHRLTVVPNFVDDEVFALSDDVAARQAARSNLGVTDDRVVIAIVAQLREEKNHPVLLAAFAQLVSSGRNVHLVIVGDGPERLPIESAVDAAGFRALVTMAGHVSQAWRTFAAADIAVLPSRHEGFPNSIVEAMAMECPVVASNVGGIPDAVEDGVTGLLVPPGDVTALATALQRLVDDASCRQRFGRAARERALSHYRADAVIDRLEALYSTLLEQ